MFQFHKGAIKTFYVQKETARDEMFQFHKGAIKTTR